MLTRRKCCVTAGEEVLPCSPIDIPQTDLTLSWTGTRNGSPWSGSMTLLFSGPDAWATAGFAATGYYTGGPTRLYDECAFVLYCQFGNLTWDFQWFSSFGGGGGICNLALTDYTGSPFHLHHTAPEPGGGGCDGSTGRNVTYYCGFNELYIDP